MDVAGDRKAPFDLLGGQLCLDFVNTLDDRGTSHPEELLKTYSDLVAWGAQTGALTRAEARRLRGQALDRPKEAEAALRHARQVREVLFEGLAALSAGRPFPAPSLRRLNAALPAALTHLQVRAASGGYEWAWQTQSGLDRALWAVLRSAGDLLTSSKVARVRACGAAVCGWLFLDASKNHSRRWCDMAVCGNRDKAKRHRTRQKAGRARK